ncbi:MAG TPA: DNA replication/repair protein RecF [Rhizomicrobium sp.]|nr:DNA replication/repair protein RecF [Rhizomicrobium sp.]
MRSEGALSPIADNAPRLAVTRLVLSQFRSYAAAELVTSGRSVVLAGPNGAGKTNVLDAISLLAPGRGLRGASLRDHVRKGPIETADNALWAVAATVARGDVSYELGTGLGLNAQGAERRRMHLNGAPMGNASELAEIVQMIWLTPAMDRLFIEGASGRRKFLDRLVLGFDSQHARRAARYEVAMRERLRLLKFGPRDPSWLEGLEAEMAETGVAMAIARAETVTRLNAALTARGSAGAFPSAQLALEGDADVPAAEDAAAAEEAFKARWAKLRMRDAEARRTTFGPHTSDLVVRHTEKRMNAADCSTGEQKALLISIVLADAWELARSRDGHAPLLLLDEVAAHLDQKRRHALFDEILALGAQAWMTGTDLSLFDSLQARADVFLVNAGIFVRQE